MNAQYDFELYGLLGEAYPDVYMCKFRLVGRVILESYMFKITIVVFQTQQLLIKQSFISSKIKKNSGDLDNGWIYKKSFFCEVF